MQKPPILKAYLYISPVIYDEEQYIELAEECSGANILLKESPPIASLIMINDPYIIISIGPSWKEFDEITNLPTHVKQRWIHHKFLSEITVDKMIECWLHASTPKHHNFTPRKLSSPLVSVFTTSYNSGDKILLPYHSLIKQTYPNWEWIIVDDSPTPINFAQLDRLSDGRIKKFKANKPSFYIGYVKAMAARLCSGEILVELDHDDELVPTALEQIVAAFENNPDCGFVFANTTEVYWGKEDISAGIVKRSGDKSSHNYGKNFGFGYGIFWKQYLSLLNQVVDVSHIISINRKTIEHLIGLPNHPRCWTKQCYQAVGGHNPELSVADDYDLLIRTFLHTKFYCIPNCLYIQYRFELNHTFGRFEDIQRLVYYLYQHYLPAISKHMDILNMPRCKSSHEIIYTLPMTDRRKTNAARIQIEESGLILMVETPGLDLSKLEKYLKSYDQIAVLGVLSDEDLNLLASLKDERIHFWKLDLSEKTYWSYYGQHIIFTKKKKIITE